jgi:hypothetical protein
MTKIHCYHTNFILFTSSLYSPKAREKFEEATSETIFQTVKLLLRRRSFLSVIILSIKHKTIDARKDLNLSAEMGNIQNLFFIWIQMTQIRVIRSY